MVDPGRVISTGEWVATRNWLPWVEYSCMTLIRASWLVNDSADSGFVHQEQSTGPTPLPDRTNTDVLVERHGWRRGTPRIHHPLTMTEASAEVPIAGGHDRGVLGRETAADTEHRVDTVRRK
jgi:hypothetical protein